MANLISNQQQAGWHQIKVVVIPDAPPHPDGPCANDIPSTAPTVVLLRSGKDTSALLMTNFTGRNFSGITETREQTMYPPLCLDNGTTYTVRLEVIPSDRGPSASILIDSVRSGLLV